MKNCRICKELKTLDLFVKNKAFKSGIDTICLLCSHQKVKEWRISGKRNAKAERDRAILRNPEKVKESETKRTRKYFELHRRNPLVYKTKEELRATKSKNQTKRRFKKSIILWDEEFTNLVLKEAHHLRLIRNKITGIEWHVDHVIPLNGKNVSGLHIWNNFQVIPAIENLRKNNRYGT